MHCYVWVTGSLSPLVQNGSSKLGSSDRSVLPVLIEDQRIQNCGSGLPDVSHGGLTLGGGLWAADYSRRPVVMGPPILEVTLPVLG